VDWDARLEGLLAHQARLLPDAAAADDFRDCILAEPDPCVRLNTLMPLAPALRPELARLGAPVGWCGDACVLAESASRLGHCLEYRLGCLYIQAKATTLAVEALAPRPGELVLDLAAAPGGKATQIAARLGNSGLLVANEPQSSRVSALVGNLERCGVHNAVVTKSAGTLLARHFANCFDRVLLDAPCSGDGIVGKDRNMLRYWSPDNARAKAIQQVGLVRAAFHMLRPGGVLVYSTCSLSTEENEDVIAGLLKRYPDQARLEPVRGLETVPLPAAIAAQYPPEMAHVARVWPHLHHTEGAVVVRVAKVGPTVWYRKGRTPDARPAADLSAALMSAAATGSADTPIEADDRAGICEALDHTWGLALSVPRGQELAYEHKHAALRPAGSEALRESLPGFVRSGMRLASLHKDHLYLSQQAVQLWGDSITRRCLDLTWPQVQALFRGDRVPLDSVDDLRGEVIARFGPWIICRGLIARDGHTLQGYVPKSLRTQSLERLTQI